jgi:hypothetical protein
VSPGPDFRNLVKQSVARSPERHYSVLAFHGKTTIPAQGGAALSQPFGETVLDIHAFGLDQAIAPRNRKGIGKMDGSLEIGGLAFQITALKVRIGFDAGHPEAQQE